MENSAVRGSSVETVDDPGNGPEAGESGRNAGGLKLIELRALLALNLMSV